MCLLIIEGTAVSFQILITRLYNMYEIYYMYNIVSGAKLRLTVHFCLRPRSTSTISTKSSASKTPRVGPSSPSPRPSPVRWVLGVLYYAFYETATDCHSCEGIICTHAFVIWNKRYNVYSTLFSIVFQKVYIFDVFFFITSSEFFVPFPCKYSLFLLFH